MANNRFSSGLISRKNGGSILATAAYIHRDQYRDERTGKLTQDHSGGRGDVEWEGLFAHDSHNVPDWWSESRERIFNELEKREDRSTRPNDAQLGYHFKVSLPHELSPEARQELITEWALRQTRNGYAVDIAIHKPNPKENDPRNYHAHVLMAMRSISENGWENKIRAPGESRTDFHKWAEHNLRDWKHQLSELGAQHLDRAGFHEEAERFRVGHLSRPERAKAAHDRGDDKEFERLIDEPQRYLGPAAAAMERNGKRTRVGDINREVAERNKQPGPARDIRIAVAMSEGNQEAFLKMLAEKDMRVARVSDHDEYHRQWNIPHAARTFEYIPEYKKGEHVIVTEQGQIYRLTPATTGENWKQIAQFNRSLEGLEFLNLADTLDEQKRRALIPKLERDSVIAEMMEKGVRDDVPVPHRTAVPRGVSHVRGESGEQLWWAYNSVKTPGEFHESLNERGIRLARVTADDAEASNTQHWASKRHGRYFPVLREGEYVAISDRGSAYRLNEESVGHNPREVKAFMSALDQKQMPSLREAQNAVHEKLQKEIDPTPRDWRQADPTYVAARGLDRVGEIAKKIISTPMHAASRGFDAAAKPLDLAATAFESLFARPISPEERKLAEVQQHEQDLAAERAERERRAGGRDR